MCFRRNSELGGHRSVEARFRDEVNSGHRLLSTVLNHMNSRLRVPTGPNDNERDEHSAPQLVGNLGQIPASSPKRTISGN